MILRTDVADSGLYIMKHWVASMISALESDSNILNESIEVSNLIDKYRMN